MCSGQLRGALGATPLVIAGRGRIGRQPTLRQGLCGCRYARTLAGCRNSAAFDAAQSRNRRCHVITAACTHSVGRKTGPRAAARRGRRAGGRCRALARSLRAARRRGSMRRRHSCLELNALLRSWLLRPATARASDMQVRLQRRPCARRVGGSTKDNARFRGRCLHVSAGKAEARESCSERG